MIFARQSYQINKSLASQLFFTLESLSDENYLITLRPLLLSDLPVLEALDAQNHLNSWDKNLIQSYCPQLKVEEEVDQEEYQEEKEEEKGKVAKKDKKEKSKEEVNNEATAESEAEAETNVEADEEAEAETEAEDKKEEERTLNCNFKKTAKVELEFSDFKYAWVLERRGRISPPPKTSSSLLHLREKVKTQQEKLTAELLSFVTAELKRREENYSFTLDAEAIRGKKREALLTSLLNNFLQNHLNPNLNSNPNNNLNTSLKQNLSKEEKSLPLPLSSPLAERENRGLEERGGDGAGGDGAGGDADARTSTSTGADTGAGTGARAKGEVGAGLGVSFSAEERKTLAQLISSLPLTAKKIKVLHNLLQEEDADLFSLLATLDFLPRELPLLHRYQEEISKLSRYPHHQEPGIIGYIFITNGGFYLDIDNVAINEQYRGLGLANLLLEASLLLTQEIDADNLGLEVRESNKRAISLYQKHGFVTERRRKNYYDSSWQGKDVSEDALIMLYSRR